MIPQCVKGPDRTPCGNARLGPKTTDQCPRCWIALNSGTINNQPTKIVPVPANHFKPISHRTDRCKFLKEQTEFNSKCRSGIGCRHRCLQGLPAVPNNFCQTCTSYVPHERVNSINPVPWIGEWTDFAVEQPTEAPTTFISKDLINPVKQNSSTMTWQYGITTVPKRRNNVFVQTLASLIRAGFDSPHIFVDGDIDGDSWVKQFRVEHGIKIPSITVREKNVRTAGHWVLTLYELWARNPHADRYAIFQDDFVTYPTLKEYLERCTYPEKGYWNLYTFPRNRPSFLKEKGLPYPEERYEGWYQSDQCGKGAVALIMDHTTVRTLLGGPYLVDRFMDKDRGHRAIDGGIVDALKLHGWFEYVHNPSLVQHIGHESSMGNCRHVTANTFRGEDYDITQLLK